MPKIKIDHVVTFSSEDNVHVASNILTNDMTKKWKTKGTGDVAANIVVQLDRVTKISGVDICNECSAFVEVLVGRSSSQGEEYQPLVIMSSFMSPMESRELRETNRVRIFSYKDLVPDVRDEKWDRVKFNCTQPFNKNIQYGLSYVTLYSPQDDVKEELKPVSLGKFKLRPESPDNLSPGSLFSKRTDKKESLSEQIKKITTKEYFNKTESSKPTTPKIVPKNNSTHTTPNTKPSTSKNRNSMDLFYESDDDKQTKKIDRLMAHRKEEEEKRKKQEKEKENSEKQKQNTPQSNSSKKRNHDKVEKTPKKENDNAKEFKNKNNNDEPKVKKQCVKKTLVRKPFNQLMNGVVFTISGIVNPERASLREKALEMGAKYKPNWDNYCTHLICAFANTPKFREVQGKGKIVTKNWIIDCYQERKRFPWRQYALDNNDQGQSESEDEILEQGAVSESISDDDEDNTPSPAPRIENSGSDTEDEVERILAKQQRKEEVNQKEVKNETKVKDKTKKEIKPTDPFDADTEEEILETKEKPIDSNLPKLFDKDMFYVDDIFEDEVKKELERLILIINGYVLDRPRTVADYIVTLEETAKDMKERFSDAKIVSPDWIYEMYNNQKMIPVDKYILAK